MPIEQQEVIPGAIVEGVVQGITRFGAFVELPDGKVGLVHISEIADTYVKDVKDFLQEGQRVKVKVLNVADNGKVGLSVRQAKEKERQSREAAAMSLEDKINKFLKESDEKLATLKLKRDTRRRNRYS
ncbi:MAG TPA: S1 RNA-binding domain-containing protein [Syntrophothermus lipocalidus]|uniref:RNA binding S1 domain protein n=1 Tax=Syntrophothermus lipocalidus (strain DSM 12680 / TGB-C1) TaxID=643648 RepID=D7CIQ3_SYNLT|nr:MULTISPECIES: S1 RNA-binding domain-containing protein [Syntrophothermus]ADI00918.1 RNA binding S1 domain protein [Syntrophothermus lipocalidus DSM 12680]NSW84151.1 S1 RNA-binding domain-containing protein [Syntrophothermus sp.]HHV77248.1 S1 RNA-binding domain-containing protein [Syntrophothermus lipocalidus]HOV42956.1 S1 RNA-binding domain-containing protein [Syntrophothermus lipocalidus]